MPPIEPGRDRYVVELRRVAPEPPAGVEISGTLPAGIPAGGSLGLTYFFNGQRQEFDLQPGQRDFRVRVPAYGGEIMAGGDKYQRAYLYQKEVGKSKIGPESWRNPEDFRQYRIRCKASDKLMMLDFLTGESAKLPVAWIRIRPGVEEGIVSLIAGSYWVRYYDERGEEPYLDAVPFTNIEIKDQEVLDFTNPPARPSEGPRDNGGK